MGIAASARLGSVTLIFNMVFERLIPSHMYASMALLGVFLASRGLGLSLSDVLPVLTIACTAMGVYVINDVCDLEIDRISHPERSLPQGKVTIRQAQILGALLLAMGPAIAFAVNRIAGMMVGMITVTGIAYSVPPVRLRRYPVVPNMMLGLGVLFAFLAGVAFRAPLDGKAVFGGLLLWAFFSFQSFVKDIEQGEGDAAGGAMTLPLVLGPERALKVTAVVALSTAVFPILFIMLFDLNWLFAAAIILLYVAEGYGLRRYAESRRDSRAEQRESGKVLDRPLLDPLLMKVMGCFLGMQLTLLVAALV